MSIPDVDRIDFLTLGGGPAGLTAALLAAEAGLRVAVADPAPPPDPEHAASDPRTTALLGPALETLERVGVWPALAPKTAPLAVMRLVEAGGGENRARRRVDFRAREAGRAHFGVNAPNAALRAALYARAESHPAIRLLQEAPRSLLFAEDAVHAEFSSGARLRARLAAAADGRDSPARAALRIGAKRVGYGQTAMVFRVAHPRPHQEVSTEIWRAGGPFTLVPLPNASVDDPLGPHRSSVVWMTPTAEAQRLLALAAADFELAASARALDALGPLRLASERAGWPVISLLADRFAGPRAALMAEAAHVVPPVGAQGLNLSLGDAAALADLIAAAARADADIGAPDLLARYATARRREAVARVAATAGLNLAAIGALRPIRDLRLLGFGALDAIPSLRQAAMRFGLGAG